MPAGWFTIQACKAEELIRKSEDNSCDNWKTRQKIIRSLRKGYHDDMTAQEKPPAKMCELVSFFLQFSRNHAFAKRCCALVEWIWGITAPNFALQCLISIATAWIKIMVCGHCNVKLSSEYSSRQLPTSDNPTRQPYTINHLAVLAAREGGINQTGLVRLTTMMNVKGGLHHKTFSAISDTIKQKLVWHSVRHSAWSRQRYAQSIPWHLWWAWWSLQLAVSYDGSWKTRGFHSPFRVGFVIEVLTGLVID